MPATLRSSRGIVGARMAVRPALPSGRAKPPARRRMSFDRPHRIIAVGLGLVAIFGAGSYLSGYVPFSLSPRSSLQIDGANSEEFWRSRIGEVLFTTGQGNACRKNQFYNDTGVIGPDMKVRCDTGQPDDQTAGTQRYTSSGSGRLLSVRDAFVGR
jgi:hypothetical protein